MPLAVFLIVIPEELKLVRLMKSMFEKLKCENRVEMGENVLVNTTRKHGP